jgi:dCMP deaminase
MRPAKAETWLEVARAVAKQSTCLRRQVGCVLVDARGHVLSTGYNGVASGMPHCNDEGQMQRLVDFGIARQANVTGPVVDMTPRGIETFVGYPNACPGAQAPSGTQLDACQAIHAEQNCLLQCRDVHQIETVYCTASPCMTCVKLLMGTSAKEICFLEEYPAVGAKELWQKSRGEISTWVKWPL